MQEFDPRGTDERLDRNEFCVITANYSNIEMRVLASLRNNMVIIKGRTKFVPPPRPLDNYDYDMSRFASDHIQKELDVGCRHVRRAFKLKCRSCLHFTCGKCERGKEFGERGCTWCLRDLTLPEPTEPIPTPVRSTEDPPIPVIRQPKTHVQIPVKRSSVERVGRRNGSRK